MINSGTYENTFRMRFQHVECFSKVHHNFEKRSNVVFKSCSKKCPILSNIMVRQLWWWLINGLTFHTVDY